MRRFRTAIVGRASDNLPHETFDRGREQAIDSRVKDFRTAGSPFGRLNGEGGAAMMKLRILRTRVFSPDRATSTLVIAATLALMTSAVLFAQESEKRAQGRRLAHVALSGGIYETMIDQVASLAVKSMLGPIEKEIKRELGPSEQDALTSVLRDTLREVLPIDVWEEALAPIYSKDLTVSEMTEMLTFFETDLGQKLLSLQRRVALDGIAAGEQLVKTHEQEFRDQLQRRMQDIVRAARDGTNSGIPNQKSGPEIQVDRTPAITPPPPAAAAGAPSLSPPPPGTFRPGGGVTFPRVVKEVKPQYTADAMRAKVQGAVLIECVVNTDGTVSGAHVIRSLDATYGLDGEAIKAANGWRFEPGTRNGEPVPVVITIELTFTLGK